ncbi:MAG: hypothetical protein JOZ09_15805 [Pseudonocardiales bacterium]|nr:hypothetical protein [Pseudonocardiales bacterium]
MKLPPSNVDKFRHKPVHAVSALLPDEQSTVAACQDLDNAGFEVTQAQILRGEEGARILDRSGTQHGYAAHLVRILQRLGMDESSLDVYDEALRNGETLISIPCASDSARDVAYILENHGGHAMFYWDRGTREVLSAP